MCKRNLNSESDIPITNKKEWVYNNYYCTLTDDNGNFQEYDALGEPIIHEMLKPRTVEMEGIRILTYGE